MKVFFCNKKESSHQITNSSHPDGHFILAVQVFSSPSLNIHESFILELLFCSWHCSRRFSCCFSGSTNQFWHVGQLPVGLLRDSIDQSSPGIHPIDDLVSNTTTKWPEVWDFHSRRGWSNFLQFHLTHNEFRIIHKPSEWLFKPAETTILSQNRARRCSRKRCQNLRFDSKNHRLTRLGHHSHKITLSL